MKRVVTFGELLLRKTPKLEQPKQYDEHFGGSEANVAASLSILGLDSSFVSRLPDNQEGKDAFSYLSSFGVDLSFLKLVPGKIGIYYNLPSGPTGRKVVYERKGSAMACAKEEDFPWEKIFAGASWYHVSGITPALSESCKALTIASVKQAKKMGLKVSLDLNYRPALWSKEDARECLLQLIPYVDLCIANEEEAEAIFAITGPSFSLVLQEIHARYKIPMIAAAFRKENDQGIFFDAMLCKDGEIFEASTNRVQMIDKIGGGDAFSAGLIYALLNDYPPKEAISFASSAGALKYNYVGDVNLATFEQIKAKEKDPLK